MRNDHYCEECYDSIAYDNDKAARLWAVFCSIQDGKVVIPSRSLRAFGEPIKHLERIGFIVTTEHYNDLIVRVVGQRDDLFCIDYHVLEDSGYDFE